MLNSFETGRREGPPRIDDPHKRAPASAWQRELVQPARSLASDGVRFLRINESPGCPAALGNKLSHAAPESGDLRSTGWAGRRRRPQPPWATAHNPGGIPPTILVGFRPQLQCKPIFAQDGWRGSFRQFAQVPVASQVYAGVPTGFWAHATGPGRCGARLLTAPLFPVCERQHGSCESGDLRSIRWAGQRHRPQPGALRRDQRIDHP